MAKFAIKIDSELKKEFEKTCNKMGLDAKTAFTMFAVKTVRENRIPFEVSIDPFYSKKNIEHIESVIAKIESGEAELTEHQLIEVDEG